MLDRFLKFGISIVVVTFVLVVLMSLGIFSDSKLLYLENDDNYDGNVDDCVIISNNIQSDFDNDLILDSCDDDDDNDGILDVLDVFDIDPNEWADFDFDGIGTNEDLDDDNDGISDILDDTPVLSSEYLATKYLQNINDCARMNDDSSRLLCYSQFFEMLSENENNTSDALELSIALSKLGTIDDCHFVSHQVGHGAFNKKPNVVENLIGMDGTMCRGGYFHGVMSAYFHEEQEKNKTLPSDYKIICNELIGSSNYQDCVHGLGHGLVHYFGEDLNSSLEKCHDMSFYQNRLCVKGVMMQYTDNVLTRQGITPNTVSNLCNESTLDRIDFVECSMSIGTTLAFFTNHDIEEGSKSCNQIKHLETQNYCLEGLRLEIQDSEKYETMPLTEETREKFQPQNIKDSSKIIDIQSPAVISNFQFIPNVNIISFSIDRPQYVILYIPNEFLSSKMMVTVNGQIPNDLSVKNNVLGEDIAMIRFIPNDAGLVMITPSY